MKSDWLREQSGIQMWALGTFTAKLCSSALPRWSKAIPDKHGHQERSTLPRWQQWGFFSPPTLTDVFANPASGAERLSSQAGKQHWV